MKVALRHGRGIACAGVLSLLFVAWSPASRADVIIPPEIWNTTITPVQIFNELIAGNFRFAFRLAKDYAIAQIRQELLNGKKIPVLGAKLAMQLNKIIDDPAKNQIQKEDEIFLLINASLEPQATAPVGPLNLTLRHSIEFGVTRLEWDQKTAHDACDGGFAGFQCTDSGPNGTLQCTGQGSASTVYVRREPAYQITRIVNGVSKNVTVLAGLQEMHTRTIDFGYSFRSVLLASLKYYYYTNYGAPFSDIAPGRVIFYDFHGDFVQKGDTLSYKVFSGDGLYRYLDCGAIHNLESTAIADGNGDGLMDFIPVAQYRKYFGKYFGWLPGVISSVLE
jgi:hypothetical protein